MLFLATRNLQVRAARTTFTALAVALGVGMIFAMRIVTATLEETARAARLSRLSGANLEITNAIGANIPLTLLPTIEARPEVETAAPIYRALEGRPSGTATFSMSGLALRGTGLALLGVDPAHTLTPYEVTAGEFLPQTPNADAVLLPADWAVLHGLGPGDSLQLDTGDETATYTIVGLLKPERGLIASAPIAWLPLDTLADAFNTPATASSILVRLAPGLNPDDAQAALQAALGDQYIVYSAHSGEAATSIFNLLNLALPVAGFAVLLTGGFLVFNAFAITLAERRREIGQLRVLGMTRGQILAQTLLEAGLVGLMGSLVGLVLGWGLGRGVIAVMGVLNGVAAAEAIIPLDAAPLALGAGVLVTLAVTLGLALQASRLSPLLALKETESHSDSPPNRLVSAGLGFAFLIAIGASYWYAQAYIRNTHTPNYGLFFLPALFFGALIVSVLPLWLEGGLWLWRRLARGVTAQLAADTLIRQRSRAALTTATLVISFMLVIALTGVTLFMSSFIIGMNVSLFSGQIVLIRTMPPGTSLVTATILPALPPLPTDMQADLDALTDEASLTSFANISIPGLGVDTGVGGDRYAFSMASRFMRGKSLFPITEGNWDEVERAFREYEPAIFLPELTARKLEKHPGDTIEIETLNGPVSFYIAGVGGAFPVITPASAVRYFNVHPFGLILEPKPGVDRTQLEQRVDAFIDRHRAEVSRLELEDIVTVVDQIIGPVQALFAGLTSLSGLVAALGIVVTLFASVLERQRELGTLRALGMTVNTVRGLVLMEAGGLGLLGSALGALGGLGMGFLFQRAILDASRALGGAVSEEIVLPWGVAGAALLIGPVVAMLAALYPADRAASVNPANAMRAESATGFLPPAKHLGPTGLRGFFARMPLAAKLSLASGLILVTALAAQTALRVDAERRLLEESLSSLFARTSDTGLDAVYTQIPADVTELTPATLDALQQRADTQVGVLQSQLLNLRGRQMADDFQLRYLLITDLQRRVVLSDPPSWLGRTLTDTVTINGSTTAVRLTDWWGERVFEGTVPIANEAGTRLGYLQVGISTGPVDGFIREVIVGSLWTMALTLLAAITVTVWLTRRALAPVARVAAASAALARGELNQRLPETSWDEGGELTRAFNDMVKGLRERERLEEELRLARHIQQTLLPKEAPRLPGWELAAEYRPARAVGGDFYDWLSLPDGRLAIIIGDVTDKGLPAALVMATTRALLRAALEHSTSPSVALEQVNNLLHPDIPPKMFATCLMAVLDPTTGRLVYANAGHDQPFHRRHSSEVVELRARGMPLGLMPGMRYEEKETCVEPGECVLFYTDGLVEAHNPQREMFGFPRLQARLAGPPLPEGPGLISALLHELAQFAGLNWEQEDDVTLVVLQRAENS